MDDFVHSFANEQEARTEDLQQAFSKAGFSLTNFFSNSAQCLKKHPKSIAIMKETNIVYLL